MNNRDTPASPLAVGLLLNDGTIDASRAGLTKREAFAMAAMQGMLANPYLMEILSDVDGIAKDAVEYADSLLKELDK